MENAINRIRAMLLAAMVAAIPMSRRRCDAGEFVDTRVVGPFVCRADFPLAEVKNSLDVLPRLQVDVTKCLGIPPTENGAEIYLFQNKSTYTKYVNRHFPKARLRRALFIKDQRSGKVLLYRGNQFDVDLRHECTHAILHAAMPVVPLWLDEGLAEYYEVPADKRVFDNPNLKLVRLGIRLGVVSGLGELEGLGGLSEMKQVDYRHAWAWVHYMLHGSSTAQSELIKFLGDIRSGRPHGLMSERLRAAVPDLDRKFAAHLKNWKNTEERNEL